MLVELGLVEQRLRAVLEVLNDGASVSDVARRYGVARQTVHRWLRKYASGGLGALADGSSRPDTCPHQMNVEVEALILDMRRAHPTWGPRTILSRLARQGIDPLPGRSSVHRALVRHGFIDPKRRRRRRSDYKRWERARAMELWQMDITGGVRLAEGTEASIVTGIDDYSRFCISAKVVARATARPVCDALGQAMVAHGVPEGHLERQRQGLHHGEARTIGHPPNRWCRPSAPPSRHSKDNEEHVSAGSRDKRIGGTDRT